MANIVSNWNTENSLKTWYWSRKQYVMSYIGGYEHMKRIIVSRLHIKCCHCNKMALDIANSSYQGIHVFFYLRLVNGDIFYIELVWWNYVNEYHPTISVTMLFDQHNIMAIILLQYICVIFSQINTVQKCLLKCRHFYKAHNRDDVLGCDILSLYQLPQSTLIMRLT